MNAQNVVIALVTEAMVSSLQELEPTLSLKARTRKAARLVAEMSEADTLAIFAEANQ